MLLSRSFYICNCFSSSRRERHGFFPIGRGSVGSNFQLYLCLAPSPRAYYINIIGYYSLFITPNVVNGRFFDVNGEQNKKARGHPRIKDNCRLFFRI